MDIEQKNAINDTLSFPSHCLSMRSFTRSNILHILDKANTWIDEHNRLILPPPLLKNKTIVNLFFEKSTRTRCSFELAAKRLGATVLNFDAQTSSLSKGETLLDTVDNLLAMGVDLFVVRHFEEGVSEQIASHVNGQASVINAGDGTGEHPTQALLDMFTIQRYVGDFNQLSVAIIGDIVHSRVAHSDIAALKTLGVKDIRLLGPAALISDFYEPEIIVHQEILSAIKNVDVIMLLRLQRERMHEGTVPNLAEYFDTYGLTQERLLHAKPGAIVMHPGPINRQVEIASEVADGRQSVILDQVTFGVAVRMALMVELLA